MEYHCFIFSLDYKGKDVPGEVRLLEINPADPKQVCNARSTLCLYMAHYNRPERLGVCNL